MNDMAVAMPEPHVFDAETYHRMGTVGIFFEGSHVELVEGDIIDMSPKCIANFHQTAIRL